jgi:hypothetical protein
MPDRRQLYLKRFNEVIGICREKGWSKLVETETGRLGLRDKLHVLTKPYWMGHESRKYFVKDVIEFFDLEMKVGKPLDLPVH